VQRPFTGTISLAWRPAALECAHKPAAIVNMNRCDI